MEITQDYSVELLDKYFTTAFAAPDGIKRLRELILTLAMRGKLVPQNPNDQPASALLKEIDEEKKQLIKEKKIKKRKPLPEITLEEIPFNLPKSWEWIRLGNIAEFINGDRGKNYPNKNEYVPIGIPWINTGHIEPNGSLTQSRMNFIAREKFDSLRSGKIQSGDLVYCLRGATFGKTAIVDPYTEGAIASSLMIIRPFSLFFNHYLYKYLISPVGRSQIFRFDNGSAQPNLSANSVRLYVFPIPPLPEQRRIVEKVDRLMEQVDHLEKLQAERDHKRLIIHTAASDRLLNAPDQNNFNEAWSFIQKNFNELYSVKENISELRKAILQLAVMGKLVPQDPNDPPASELLKEIKREKQRLIKEKKIKKRKLLSEIKPEEIPYQIPNNWKWSNIQNISLKVTDGEHKTPIRSDKGYYLLSARNVTNEGIKLDKVDYVLEEEYTRIRKRCDPEIGDILISCSGSVGRVAIVDSNEYVMVRSVALIKHKQDCLSSSFLAYVLRSPFVQYQIKNKSRTTAQSNLFLGKINEILIPLPPLPEQHRIVAKVDRLMALCDQLEKQSIKRTEKQSKLLEAILAKI